MKLLNSIGHFFAKVLPAIVGFEKKVAPAIQAAALELGKIDGTEKAVEALTASLGPSAGRIVALESAIYGGFGVAHDLLVALGTAAASGSVVTITASGVSSTLTVDAGVAQSILDAGRYIQAHPLGGVPPAGAVK